LDIVILYPIGMKKNRLDKRIPLTQNILGTIARIDQFRGLWSGSLRLAPQILGRLKSWVIITSTGASTRIEGATMTDEEIARFLRGIKTTRPKNRDEQEVAGYADVIGRIFDHWKTLKLSESWILQLHSILLQFSDKDVRHKGDYKHTPNTVVMINPHGENVVLFNPTPPHLVKGEMLEAIGWTNEQLKGDTLHPLLVIANFIFEFLAIHPFTDGNGRLSRALTNLLLLKAGYAYIPYVSLDEIIEETKAEYYLALRSAQKHHKTKHEDIAPWVTYFLGILARQTVRASKLLQEDQPEKLLSARQTEVYRFFDDENELSVADVVTLLHGKMPRETIKQALSRLMKLKLIERIGQARGTRYKKRSG